MLLRLTDSSADKQIARPIVDHWLGRAIRMSRFAADVRAYHQYAAEFDTPIRCELLYGDPLVAVARIASRYKIARYFPKRCDLDQGLPRYGPVATAIQKYPADGSKDPVMAVVALTRDLTEHYQTDLLTAASKFLSFAWGRDVFVYDPHALKALQTRFPTLKPRDYQGFCSAWVAAFNECADEISAECTRQNVSAERWFTERVFDWHLWRSGW